MGDVQLDLRLLAGLDRGIAGHRYRVAISGRGVVLDGEGQSRIDNFSGNLNRSLVGQHLYFGNCEGVLICLNISGNCNGVSDKSTDGGIFQVCCHPIDCAILGIALNKIAVGLLINRYMGIVAFNFCNRPTIGHYKLNPVAGSCHSLLRLHFYCYRLLLCTG